MRRLFWVLALACIVQTAHFAEHVVQLVQIYAAGIAPPDAHGLLGSVFDFEWVHFLYNIGLEILLLALWLAYRAIWPSASRQRLWPLVGVAVFQGYHAVEHIIKLYQFLFIPLYQSGRPPTPGFLPVFTGWPIFLVHFWLNAIVWAAMLAVLWRLRPNALSLAAADAGPAVSHP